MLHSAGKLVDLGNMKGSHAAFSSKNGVPDRASVSRNSGSKVQTNTMVKDDCNVGFNKEKGTRSPRSLQNVAISGRTEKYCRNLQGQEGGSLGDTTLFMIHEPELDAAKIEPISGDSKKVIQSGTNCMSKVVRKENHTLGTEGLGPEVHAFQHYKAPNAPMLNLSSPCKKENEPSLFIEEERKSKLKTPVSSNDPLGKMNSTAENDLVLLNVKSSSGATHEIIVLESTHEGKSCSKKLDGEEHLGDNTVSVKDSQFGRTERYKRKDKGKALLDADVNGRMSSEQGGSYESVESCNSTGSSVAGMKRQMFEKQFSVGSKRVKSQVEVSPSISFARQESSFMNWISNILKGLSRSDQDGPSSLALALTHPNRESESQDHNLIMRVENQDSECKMGFRSIFQSLYSSNSMAQVARAPSVQCQMEEGSKELVSTNEKFNQLTSGDGAGPSTVPLRLSATSPVIQENGNSDSGNLQNLACGKVADRTSSSNSSLRRHKRNGPEKKDFDSAIKEETTSILDHRSVHQGSLWITRFALKTSSSVVNVDHCSHRTRGFEEKLLNDVGKESPKYAASTESPFGLERPKRHDNGKFMDKQNPNLQSLTFKGSVAAASVLARRLNALKHIIQLTETDNPARTAGICLFCGSRGHDIQDCSDITESELEDLLRNIHADDKAEESPGLCIKCFQLNHWAISCPNASSRRCSLLECDASLVDNCGRGKVCLNTEKESNLKPLGSNERFHSSGVDVVCSSPRMETKFTLSSPDKVISTLDKGKCIASSSGKTRTLSNYVHGQISEVPEVMFDAIRKLRLSRTDILNFKRMNSHASLARLDGYFLRLRLGKWEEGLGGTGYYVACISEPGAQRNTQCVGGDQISVNVGGTQCSVESQYISNHDFLEDELMAWWCTTLRGGGEIPSEQGLRLKFEGKKELGL